jgi:hypothetical protein
VFAGGGEVVRFLGEHFNGFQHFVGHRCWEEVLDVGETLSYSRNIGEDSGNIGEDSVNIGEDSGNIKEE